MIVTKEQLKALNMCTDGYKYWLKVNKPNIKEFMLQAWEDSHADWANWLFVRVVPRELYLKYAIYSAELVLPIFENKYPNDKRPRNAIEAAKKVLDHDSVENRHDAYAAYDAASSASFVFADFAAYAASRAAFSCAAFACADFAAYAASSAASFSAAVAAVSADASVAFSYASSDACFPAAYASVSADASASADRKKTEKKIIDYGIKILREYEEELEIDETKRKN